MNMANSVANQYFISKRFSLLILAVTALICSRTLLFSFHDPEGPNLLVVTGLTLVLYAVSITAYLFGPLKINGLMRILATVGVQLLCVVILYFCMR